MMEADDFGNLRTGKLLRADDLMPNDRVVPHLAVFFRIELRSFSEQSLIDGNLADVVQIARRAERRNIAGVHSHGFADRLGVAPDPQRVSMNVDVFDIDVCRESLERLVVESMQRGQKP